MKERTSQGLLAIWADIDDDYLPEFEKWHNCEHVMERINIPGFNLGCRYRNASNSPQFFMFYELDDASVSQSKAYLDRLNHLTPWTKEALTHFKNSTRAVYKLIYSLGTIHSTGTPNLYALKFNLNPGEEADALDQMLHQMLPAIMDVAEVLRIRLFISDETSTKAAPETLTNLSPSAAHHKYLILCDLKSLHLPTRDFGSTIQLSAYTIFRNANFANFKEEVYWLEFMMSATQSVKHL